MLVRIPDEERFVAELAGDQHGVARRRVRVERSYRRLHSITHLIVVASAKVLSIAQGASGDDYDVIRFEQHVGDLWGHTQDDEVKQLADEIVEKLTTDLEAAGFVVAAGFYAEPVG